LRLTLLPRSDARAIRDTSRGDVAHPNQDSALAARWGLLLVLGVAGCNSTPTGPTPTPTPNVPTHSVSVVVFFDENENGNLDPQELGRLPDVEVQIGGRIGVSVIGSGTAVVPGVPEGDQTASVVLASLPMFFEAGEPRSVSVPATAPLEIPVIRPVGTNIKHAYMAAGDSISEGFGSSSGEGYRRLLARRLEVHWGPQAFVWYPGPGGGTSEDGLERIDNDLVNERPAYTFVQWGVNDWLNIECQADPTACDVLANLRAILDRVRAANSKPVLATITPTNVGASEQAPPEREEWVRLLNEEIRALALEQGALLVDVHAAMVAAGPTAALFADHVHPNDAGYEVIADAYFRAITGRR